MPSKRGCTTLAARNASSGEVRREVSMPEVEEVSFSLSLTTIITARSSGQCYEENSFNEKDENALE
jgi:hypothetical protein